MKKVLLIVIFCFFISGSVFAQNEEIEVLNDYFDIAQNYLNDGDSKKATEYINLILLISPKNEKALDFKEITAIEITNLNSENTKTIQDTLLQSPGTDKSSICNNKGVELYNSEKPLQASKYFKQAILNDINNYRAYHNLAIYYQAQGNTALAKLNLKLAYGVNNQFSEALVDLANLSKNKKEKLKYLNRAAEMKDTKAYYYLGEYYQSENNYIQAIQYYNKVLLSDPNIALAHLKLADCYYNLEKYSEAILNYKNYLTFVSDSDYTRYMLAKSYLRQHYVLNAENELKKAITNNPNSKYIYELAKIYYFEQNYEKAINLLEKIVEVEQNSRYYNLLGLCYFETEKVKEALKNFEKALKINESNAAIYFNISKCYRVLTNNAMADHFIDLAQHISPKTPSEYTDLAIMYYKISQPEKAMFVINEGLRKFPKEKLLYKVKLKLCKLTNNKSDFETTKKDLSMKFGIE